MSCVTCRHFVDIDLNIDGDTVIECNRIGCFEHILEKDAANCPDYELDIDKEAENGN